MVDYLKQEDTALQGALAEVADEYEARPEGLGAQERVASQQPELVTGGKIRQYQVEGLGWLKSLWITDYVISSQMRWTWVRPSKPSP
jgi:hypothetical protein